MRSFSGLPGVPPPDPEIAAAAAVVTAFVPDEPAAGAAVAAAAAGEAAEGSACAAAAAAHTPQTTVADPGAAGQILAAAEPEAVATTASAEPAAGGPSTAAETVAVASVSESVELRAYHLPSCSIIGSATAAHHDHQRQHQPQQQQQQRTGLEFDPLPSEGSGPFNDQGKASWSSKLLSLPRALLPLLQSAGTGSNSSSGGSNSSGNSPHRSSNNAGEGATAAEDRPRGSRQQKEEERGPTAAQQQHQQQPQQEQQQQRKQQQHDHDYVGVPSPLLATDPSAALVLAPRDTPAAAAAAAAALAASASGAATTAASAAAAATGAASAATVAAAAAAAAAAAVPGADDPFERCLSQGEVPQNNGLYEYFPLPLSGVSTDGPLLSWLGSSSTQGRPLVQQLSDGEVVGPSLSEQQTVVLRTPLQQQQIQKQQLQQQHILQQQQMLQQQHLSYSSATTSRLPVSGRLTLRAATATPQGAAAAVVDCSSSSSPSLETNRCSPQIFGSPQQKQQQQQQQQQGISLMFIEEGHVATEKPSTPSEAASSDLSSALQRFSYTQQQQQKQQKQQQPLQLPPAQSPLPPPSQVQQQPQQQVTTQEISSAYQDRRREQQQRQQQHQTLRNEQDKARADDQQPHMLQKLEPLQLQQHCLEMQPQLRMTVEDNTDQQQQQQNHCMLQQVLHDALPHKSLFPGQQQAAPKQETLQQEQHDQLNLYQQQLPVNEFCKVTQARELGSSSSRWDAAAELSPRMCAPELQHRGHAEFCCYCSCPQCLQCECCCCIQGGPQHAVAQTPPQQQQQQPDGPTVGGQCLRREPHFCWANRRRGETRGPDGLCAAKEGAIPSSPGGPLSPLPMSARRRPQEAPPQLQQGPPSAAAAAAALSTKPTDPPKAEYGDPHHVFGGSGETFGGPQETLLDLPGSSENLHLLNKEDLLQALGALETCGHLTPDEFLSLQRQVENSSPGVPRALVKFCTDEDNELLLQTLKYLASNS